MKKRLIKGCNQKDMFKSKHQRQGAVYSEEEQFKLEAK